MICFESFDLGEIGIFGVTFIAVALAGGPKDGKRIDAH